MRRATTRVAEHRGAAVDHTLATRLLLLAVGCQTLVIAGCNAGFDIAGVSGRVTLDGQPLAGARVMFEPQRESASGERREVRGPLSSGITDDEGRFALKTEDGRSGAVVGRHRVRFSTRKTDVAFKNGMPSLSTAQPETLPPRYNQQSSVYFDVPSDGINDAVFALTTD